jgi:hypothetical protein
MKLMRLGNAIITPMGNTKIIKRDCNYCGNYYEGFGLKYCSRLCQNRDLPNQKDWHEKLSARSKKFWTPEKRKWRSELNKSRGIRPPGFQKGVPLGRDISGDRNPNWRGGKTLEGQLIRTTNVYKAWRKAVYERDGYKCIWCGVMGNGKNLNADHILPFAIYEDLRLEVSNGRTLCIDCHKKTDTWGRPKKK